MFGVSFLQAAPPWMGLDQCPFSEVFLVGHTCACVLVDGAGSVSLKGNAMSSGVFGDVYGVNMAVDSLSANGQACVTR